MKNVSEFFYSHLPVSLQNVVCSAYGHSQRKLRYGKHFQKCLEWLEQSQWWSEEQIKDYQDKELRCVVKHAYETVPYYKEVFDKIKLKPLDIKTVDDLWKIPVLTKEDIRLYRDKLVSSSYKKKDLIFSHTSGSTGKSLQFFTTKKAVQFQWAVWWRHRRRFNIDFDSKYATFTGKVVVPIDQRKPPFWRENVAFHQTIFPMHHIVKEKIKAIVDRLNVGDFIYYSGYPSIIYNLATLIEEEGLSIENGPKIIFTGAETLYEYQRERITKVFGCPVTDQYGFSEGAGNASRCENDLFHEDFEFGILEPFEPKQIDDSHIRGTIIATGFSNYAMPFIRYQVGDIGIWKDEKCSCGRKSKVLVRIEGREEDYVITPEGAKIMRFDYIFKDTQNIKEAQVVQKEIGAIILRIVRRPNYSRKDEKMLIEEIRTKISPSLRVEFEYVDAIERTSTGKFQAVKSLLHKSQKSVAKKT